MKQFKNIYEEIGVKTVINAGGTKTTHGGTKMNEAVLEAMLEASRYFVDITELNKKIGEYIAKITGAEKGMVTSGAASGMVLSLAACMTGNDISKIMKLPNSQNMKNEVVIQKIHVGAYTHIYSFTGAKINEIGTVNDCLKEELASAINENTAAVAYLCGPRISKAGLSLTEIVDIAHSKNVPVIVDAAAMLPPKTNLRKYIDEGADLVVFSGGKFIHGPQDTGLLFGRSDLVDYALANSNPHHAIGRPNKVSRESMVGLFKALQLYMELDEELLLSTYCQRLKPIEESLKALPGITVSIIMDGINYHVPALVIEFSPAWKRKSPAEVKSSLINHEEPIFVQYFKELNHLAIFPVNLQEEETPIVIKRLLEELSE